MKTFSSRGSSFFFYDDLGAIVSAFVRVV